MTGNCTIVCGDDLSSEVVKVRKWNDTYAKSRFAILDCPGHVVTVYLTHDQAWHLRDDLNTILADGCPTSIDVDGLHADAHAALSAVERVCERVGLNKVKDTDAAIAE